AEEVLMSPVEWGFGVELLQRRPVLVLPAGIGQGHVADPSAEIVTDGNRDPLNTGRRLDLVAIAPVVLCELHVVEEHEDVHVVDEIEIPLPRDVIGLTDGDPFHSSDRLNSSIMSA